MYFLCGNTRPLVFVPFEGLEHISCPIALFDVSELFKSASEFSLIGKADLKHTTENGGRRKSIFKPTSARISEITEPVIGVNTILIPEFFTFVTVRNGFSRNEYYLDISILTIIIDVIENIDPLSRITTIGWKQVIKLLVGRILVLGSHLWLALLRGQKTHKDDLDRPKALPSSNRTNFMQLNGGA